MESTDDGFDEAFEEIKQPDPDRVRRTTESFVPKGAGKACKPARINTNYDLKDTLLGLIKLQELRVRRMVSEETARWTRLGKEQEAKSKGTRSLDPGLSKEIATVLNLVECMFKVGGNAPDGKVKKKKEVSDEVSEAEQEENKLDNMIKNKMAKLTRKVNGGG